MTAPSAASPCPGFIVTGAMRAGTTSLYRHLCTHPEIGMSREKETDFFIEELNFARGADWYQGLFPADRAVYGECSPNYTKFDVFPGVPERIKAHNPECKFIYVVRDPLERAVSQYKFWRAEAGGEAELTQKRIRHITNTSRYFAQTEYFLKHFPRDNFLFVDFADLTADPAAVLHRISGLLGVSDAWGQPETGGSNSAGELSRMPRWFFTLRQNRLVSDLRRLLPDGMQDRLRRVLASGPAREVPDLDPQILAHMREDLAPDMEKFRAMTGQAFESWSV